MKPTPEQVTRFTAELHRKFDHIPGMAARIDRGGALALAGDVYPLANGYAVASSRNDGTGYHLDEHGACTCPDTANGAPLIRRAKFCKHRIAFNLHHRALCENLAARILGAAMHDNHRQQYLHPNTYLTIIPATPGNPTTTLWSDRDGLLANVRWNTPLAAWQPATTADKITLERWLDHADPLPAPRLEEQLEEILDRADAMTRDAEIMPFPAWRNIYRPILAH